MEKFPIKISKWSLGDQLGYLKQPRGFSSKAIKVAHDPNNWKCRAIVPPIVTSAIFEVSLPLSESEHFYGRLSNPTREILEENLAALDNAKYALAFSAGVAAITALITTLSSGDGIIASKKFYNGIHDSFDIAQNLGIEINYVDFSDLKNVESALKKNTKIVWAEPIMNPSMAIIDIKKLSKIVHANSNAHVVVDNTFLSPYFHRPLELGADIALYSVTKYFCGHNDIIGGSISCNDDKIYNTLKNSQYVTGTMSKCREHRVNKSYKI